MIGYIMVAVVCALIGWMIGSAARVEREQNPTAQFELAGEGRLPPGLAAVLVFVLLVVLAFWSIPDLVDKEISYDGSRHGIDMIFCMHCSTAFASV